MLWDYRLAPQLSLAGLAIEDDTGNVHPLYPWKSHWPIINSIARNESDMVNPPPIPSKANRPSQSSSRRPPLTRSYSGLPSVGQWHTDTRPGRVGMNANDPVLRTIDDLMGALRSAADGAELYLRGLLFFATMTWLNQYKRDPRMSAECRKPILSLNLFAANDLARVLNCSLRELASKLQDIYGVEMSEHGVNTDLKHDCKEEYLSNALRERYRLFILQGLACHYKKAERKFRPLVKGVFSGMREGYGFVLSMSNVMYVGELESKVLSYHSYFMGGRSVQCAGTISFDNGKVVYLKNDSGHYKPCDPSLVKVLLYLRMNGVEMVRIKVAREFVDVHTRGDIFLMNHGNWDAIRARADHQTSL